MKKETNKEKYKTFITPDFVYIPVHSNTVAYTPKSYVYDSTLLLIDDNGSQIYSSVSGTLIGQAHVMTTNGRTNSMVIENDFLEKKKNSKGQKKHIFKMTSTEMDEILNEFNLNYGFNKDVLVISLSYDKFYNLNDKTLLKENIVEILEVTDALSSAYDIKDVVFAVNENDEESLNLLNEYIGTYQNFKVSTTKYNFDSKDKIVKKLYGNKIDNVVIISLLSIEAIGYALKSRRLLKNKFITLTNGPLKKPLVVYTKIGTCTSELLAGLKIKYDLSAVKLVGSSSEIVGKNEGIVTKDLETIVLSR